MTFIVYGVMVGTKAVSYNVVIITRIITRVIIKKIDSSCIQKYSKHLIHFSELRQMIKIQAHHHPNGTNKGNIKGGCKANE